MKVKDVMSKDVIKVAEGTSLKGVAEILLKFQISGLLVVDKNEKLVGLVSEKDVFRKLYPDYDDLSKLNLDNEKIESKVDEVKDLKVDDFMISKIETVEADSSVAKAGAIMLTKRINRLPVLENGKLVGIVSRRDIYKNILQTELGLGI